ncbi:type II CAAX prenyl endopeptidase Rce1 family protein [Bacteroidota bacterium]
MKFTIKDELKKLYTIIKGLDKKVVIVFIAVGVLQTVSWYYASRKFFRRNFYHTIFANDPNVQLYEYLFWFITDFITLFMIPILIIIFIHKEKPKDYGLKFGDARFGFFVTILCLAVMGVIVWFVSAMPSFAVKYPHLQSARGDWTLLLIYEAGMLLYMFAWEFIWRGYMLFGLEEKFGYYAVLIQMIPFVILHNGKPDIETFSAIIAGIALGIIALRTRSFLYGVFVHFGVMLGIDFISSLRFRVQDYGIGIDSFIKVISEIF